MPGRTSAGAAKYFDSMMLTNDGEHVFVNSRSWQPDKMVVWTLTQSHGVPVEVLTGDTAIVCAGRCVHW